MLPSFWGTYCKCNEITPFFSPTGIHKSFNFRVKCYGCGRVVSSGCPRMVLSHKMVLEETYNASLLRYLSFLRFGGNSRQQIMLINRQWIREFGVIEMKFQQYWGGPFFSWTLHSIFHCLSNTDRQWKHFGVSYETFLKKSKILILPFGVWKNKV